MISMGRIANPLMLPRTHEIPKTQNAKMPPSVNDGEKIVWDELEIPDCLKRKPEPARRIEAEAAGPKYDTSYRDEPWYQERVAARRKQEDEAERAATMRRWELEYLAEKRLEETRCESGI